MKPLLIVAFVLLASNFAPPCTAQRPDAADARRKELEADRTKVAKRIAEINAELARLKSAPDEVIEGFLGISADFKICARWEEDGLVFTEPGTNKKLPAPEWDRDWGPPRAVLFGAEFLAVPAGKVLPANSVKVFSKKTLELERNFRDSTSAASLADEGRRIALVVPARPNGIDKKLELRDLATNKVIAEIKPKTEGRYFGLASAGKYVAFGQNQAGDDLPFSAKAPDFHVNVIDVQTGKLSAEVMAGQTGKWSGISVPRLSGMARLPLAISPDGLLLAWANEDDVIVLWDIKAAKVLHRLVGHADSLSAVIFLKTGDLLVSAAKDKTVRFWKTATGQPVHTIKNLSAVVTDIFLSADGKSMLTVMGEKQVPTEARAEVRKIDFAAAPAPANDTSKVFEAERSKLAKQLEEIEAELAKLRPAKAGDPVVIEGFLGISPDFRVCARWDDGTLLFTEVETRKLLPAPPWDADWGHPRMVLFGADYLAVPAFIPRPAPKKSTKDGGGSGKGSKGFPFSGQQNVFAGSVRIISAKTFEQVHNIRGGSIGAADLTDEGRVIAVTPAENVPRRERHLLLYNLQARKVVADVELDNRVGDISLVAAGKYVATGQGGGFDRMPPDGLITILNAQTGMMSKVDAACKPMGTAFLAYLRVAVSASGTLVAWADDDAVVVYDAKAGKVLHRLEGHLDAVSALTFSAHGDLIATAAKDKTVRIWDVATGKSVHTIKSLPATVSTIILSADSKRVLTISGDSLKSAGKRAEIRNISSR